MEGFIFIVLLIFIFIGFNYFMGYRRGNIVLDLDNRYTNFTEYMQAIERELIEQGKDVQYQGNGEFIINGKKYVMQERNVPMGGVPLQRTVLKRMK